MDRAVQAGIPSLLVIAGSVSDDALTILIANQKADKLGTLAVRAPSVGPQRAGILQDLATLTGGRALTSAMGREIRSAQLTDLGRARRVWATRDYFGIVGGRGDAQALRQRIRQVRAEIRRTQDGEERDKLRQRLGRLLGGVARLRIGASTQTELEARKAVAERAVPALRKALEGGVVPGGGAALLACQRVLPETAGSRILSRALEEPLRVIAENGGYEPGSVVARVRACPPGWGFDARTGELMDLWQEGILDPAVVLQAAVKTAVSGAVMALTTDVLVHRRRPPESLEP
jgi:chaperonin GroEL